MVHLIKLLSRSPRDTLEIGGILAGVLDPGDVVALSGVLGSGKSVMARGILRSLGVEGDIPSPSFVIVAAYDARVPVNHIDLYRIKSEEEALGLGLEDLLYSDAVCVIEWADKIEHLLPSARIEVTLETGKDPDDRLITFRSPERSIKERMVSMAGALISLGDA